MKEQRTEVSKFANELFAKEPCKREDLIPPQMFLGWRENNVIDFSLYDSIGFLHPKKVSSYSMKDDFFKELYENLKMRPRLDTPIHVYLHEENEETKIVVIDGATRVSIISLLREEDPSLFQTVPVVYCSGSKDEAIADMVRLNLAGRHRPLSNSELFNSIKRFIDLGWTQVFISEKLGLSVSKVNGICKAIKNCKSEKLIEAMEKSPENFKMGAFLNACEKEEEEQEEIAEKVLDGKVIKTHNIKKQTIKQFISQLNNIPTRILSPLTVLMKDRGQYDGDDGLKDAIIEAIDAIDIIIEKLCDKFSSELNMSSVEKEIEEDFVDDDEPCLLEIKSAYDASGRDITDKVKKVKEKVEA